MRSLAILSLVTLAACGDADSAGRAAASASALVEARLVSDDLAVRQRLSPAEIVAYFPAEIDGREPRLDARALHDDTAAAGWSRASVRYDRPSGMSDRIEIAVVDYVDDPEGLARDRLKIDDGAGLDTYGTGTVSERREVGGGMGRHVVPAGDGPPELHLLLADRFYVTVRAEQSDLTPDALWDLYAETGLARLAAAPPRGETGIPPVPAWAAAAVAEWERTEAPPPAPAADARPLPACDDVLPLAEVERVCGVAGVRVYPTAFVDEGAAACNRKYAIPGNLSGLVLIVSRFGDAATARQAQGVASESDDVADRRDVAGLGDAATRYVRDSAAQRTMTGVLAVAVGTDLVEMKTTTMPDEPDAGVCTLDDLETLTRGVAARLR